MPRIPQVIATATAKTIATSIALIMASAASAQPRSRAPPPPPPQAAPPNVGLFPCRSEKEICFVGAVKDGKLFVLFTNDAKAEDIMGKSLAATSGEADAPLDMSANEGRVVMMTGTYDPKGSLAKAEVVDVASPLTAFAIKANGAGGGDDGPPGPPPPPAGKKR